MCFNRCFQVRSVRPWALPGASPAPGLSAEHATTRAYCSTKNVFALKDSLWESTATPSLAVSPLSSYKEARPVCSATESTSTPSFWMGNVGASIMALSSTASAIKSPAVFLPKEELTGKSGVLFATQWKNSPSAHHLRDSASASSTINSLDRPVLKYVEMESS